MQEESEVRVNQRKRPVFSTKAIAYTAVLTALSALCNIFTWNFGTGNSNAISLTYLPDFLAGAFLGPIPGFICGLLGDLIGCWIAPKGAINPFILVSSGMLGLIPGVVFWLFRGKKKEVKYPVVAAIVSMIAVYGVCTNLNTIGIFVMTSYISNKYGTMLAWYVYRTPWQTVVWAINAFLCVLLYIPMRKILKIDN
ncbi:MAG: folate family ECF transporter S component [Clostridia bacterium]|nr:folate family ECF transporter S component [Clostridia bacterium]